MPRVLGIDPGSLLTGFGCLEPDPRAPGGARVIDGGVIRLKRGASLSERLYQLHEDLTGIIRELRPDLIAVEALFTHYQKPAPVIVMGHARGVILLAAKQASLPLTELRPAEVKKAVTGFGNAKKPQIQRSIAAELGVELAGPADVADALAIALCALRRSRLELPAAVPV